MTASRATLYVAEIADDVLEGLSATPKRLPPKLFYDAAGSSLFDEITRLPEYYPTRHEIQIFKHHAEEIVSSAGEQLDIVELGAGMATKTRVLLRAALRRQLALTYTPVDISADALHLCAKSLREELLRIEVKPCVADFSERIPVLPQTRGTRLMLYIGSSIGNFDPAEAQELLRMMRGALRRGDALLLGTDMRKDEATLVAAYDDSLGITARFNKNMLARINRELGANFALDRFKHVALWNSDESRIEIYLESEADQTVFVAALKRRFAFTRGERIHTENSYKYTREGVEQMLGSAGFRLEKTWMDEREWYSVHLARAA